MPGSARVKRGIEKNEGKAMIFKWKFICIGNVRSRNVTCNVDVTNVLDLQTLNVLNIIVIS